MGELKYFFDSYALYEFVNGNVNYKKYFENYDIVLTRLNVIELFYVLLKDFNLNIARKYCEYFKAFVVEFSEEVLEKAMVFKLKNKDKKLSYIDCIGHQYALSNNLKFLTGDVKFKNFKNVEYVK